MPGELVEVDYDGDPIEWIDLKTAQLHKTWAFVPLVNRFEGPSQLKQKKPSSPLLVDH